MMKPPALLAAGLLVLGLAGPASAQTPGQAPMPRTGDPGENLPANITQLTWFGERASWSPEGKRIAFMSKSFGDAFEIDLATRRIKLLTHFPNPGFLRVQYLPNGDYLLVGARQFQDVSKTRYSDQELWYLRKDLNDRPIPLEQKLTEGVAISRSRMKIAWAMDPRTHPNEVPANTAIIYTGDIVEKDGKPVLTNKREAVRLTAPDCHGTEPQDFRNDDRELIFVCYEYNMARKAMLAKVRGVDLASGKVTIYLQDPNEYNEVEGIYPDGRHALVESSRDQKTATSRTIDIWKLRLDSKGRDMRRLTRWGDYEGFKASNPVVSPDGRTIAFQSAKSTDEAGVGYGIFLLRDE
jgi:Tol biopolymer transport system component